MSCCMTAARTLSVLIKSGIALDFENVLARNFEQLVCKGDIAVDIGAHSGRHLDKFASLVGHVGRVIAVEPLPDCFVYLRSKYSSQGNVSLHNLALSNFVGSAEFVAVTNSPEESGLREKIYNDPDRILNKIQVTVDTLDNLTETEPRIDFIKIDVEGAEINLLEGGRTCLKRTRPFISVEYGFPGYSAYGHVKTSLFDLAASLDYLCADLYGNFIESRADWEAVCDAVYWDYLLVPEEKRSSFVEKMTALGTL